MIEYYKIKVKPKLISRNRGFFFILIKGTIHQEDTTFLNIYAPNSGAASFIKQILLGSILHINLNTKILSNISTLLSLIDKSSRQDLKREAS